MKPHLRDRLSTRAERIADKLMQQHGGDWGYRILSPSQIPPTPALLRVSLPVKVTKQSGNDAPTNPKRSHHA